MIKTSMHQRSAGRLDPAGVTLIDDNEERTTTVISTDVNCTARKLLLLSAVS